MKLPTSNGMWIALNVMLCAAVAVIFLAARITGAEPAGPTTKIPEVIEFNRDVRPILAEKCFACHGPDKNKRQADLRLDTEQGLLGKEGEPGVVVPGKPTDSELWRRITSDDPEERMPPPDSGKELLPVEKQLLQKWIEQGGKWEGHWAFLPIGRPQPPSASSLHAAMGKNEIDSFILQALEEHELAPAPEADKATLLRRLRFDLTGLPPSVEELDAFIADASPDAYEKVVDRLLASPQYGERMALWWLDLVRFADSVGYHGDQPMHVWPFRDYVINSFNENKRFDEFTREQLAGDLLPDATRANKIASGYNRLGMMSAEGGVQPKEYLAKYIAERARNLGGTWLGVSLGCCECHDHKYDPFTMVDFYSLEAFFADIEEQGLYSNAENSGKWGSYIQLSTPEQEAELKRLEGEIAALQKSIDTPTPELAAAQKTWEQQQPNDLPEEIQKILATAEVSRAPADAEKLAAYYRSIAPALESVRKQLAEVKSARDQLNNSIPTTLVTVAVAPRTIRVLPRGYWMDDSMPPLDPAFPKVLSHPQPDAGASRLTRLELATWVTSRENPLTARVFVNRLWKLFFGAGLSRKLDDHGVQGEWPSHPQLLDWLAGRFLDSGWDIKHTVKLIVMSGAYRQSSETSTLLRERDPDNRWFARQGRFRLDAEMVRDNALSVGGLLVEKIGGPSVKPYQPAGYWSFLNFPQREWQNGAGDELYRRGLYTHWQRQYLHPALSAFDTPSREECAADRARSNTPLQSLVLMNDPEFVEAARNFATLILTRAGETTQARLEWAYRRAVARLPRDPEAALLARLLAEHLAQYKSEPQAADALLAVGAQPAPAHVDHAELAAWSSVARTILNLDETITRR